MQHNDKIIFQVVNDRMGYTATFKDTEASFYGIVVGLSKSPEILVTVNNQPITSADLDEKYKDTDIKNNPDYIKGIPMGYRMIYE